MRIRVTKWKVGVKNRTVEGFLDRPAFDDKAEESAQDVLSNIRKMVTPRLSLMPSNLMGHL